MMFRHLYFFAPLLLQIGYSRAQYYNGQVRIDSLDKSYLFQITDNPAQTHPLHFYHWFKSGRLYHTQGSYYGKLLHGYYKVVDKQRRLMEEGRFRMGEKRGPWRTWHENGFLKTRHRQRFWDGAMLVEVFDENGKRLKKGFEKNDLFTGRLVERTSDSVIVTRFKKGIRQPVNNSKK